MVFDVALWKVVVAVVAYFIVGALWYSKLLFAKRWAAASGKNTDEMNMAMTPMVLTFLAEALLVVLMAYFAQATGLTSVVRGVYLGVKLWAVLAAGALINHVFAGRSNELYVIDMGYHLVGLAVAGAILAA